MENNKWMFKIELMDNTVFDKYENKYDISIPGELRAFVTENNAANPRDNLVIIAGTERVMDAILSFNENETDAVTFETIFSAMDNKAFIPFAMDPFGNVFCYDTTDKSIVFYDHEENRYENSEKNLKEFVDSMYA